MTNLIISNYSALQAYIENLMRKAFSIMELKDRLILAEKIVKEYETTGKVTVDAIIEAK